MQHFSLLQKLGLAAFLLNAAAFLTVGVLALYPWKGIEIYNQPYVLDDDNIVAGEWISYYIDYCRFTDVDSHVIHELEDQQGNTRRVSGDAKVSATDGIRLSEGCGQLTKSVYIPPHIPPDTYRLVESVSYDINPFHTSSYQFKTDWFVVNQAK